MGIWTDSLTDLCGYGLHCSRIGTKQRFLVSATHQFAHVHAEWYNILSNNCRRNFWLLTLLNPEHVPYSRRIMLSGYLPEYLYEQCKLATSEPLADLRRRALVNSRAQSADNPADFSQRIRADRGSATRGAAGR